MQVRRDRGAPGFRRPANRARQHGAIDPLDRSARSVRARGLVGFARRRPYGAAGPRRCRPRRRSAALASPTRSLSNRTNGLYAPLVGTVRPRPRSESPAAAFAYPPPLSLSGPCSTRDYGRRTRSVSRAQVCWRCTRRRSGARRMNADDMALSRERTRMAPAHDLSSKR